MKKILLSALVCTVCVSPAAFAEDGRNNDKTGWYGGLKGGVSLLHKGSTKSAFEGLPNNGEIGVYSSGFESFSKSNAAVGAKLGYDFYRSHDTPVRMEIDYTHRGQVKKGAAKVKMQTVMLNGQYDFRNDTKFTPYVTAGAGYAHVRVTNPVEYVLNKVWDKLTKNEREYTSDDIGVWKDQILDVLSGKASLNSIDSEEQANSAMNQAIIRTLIRFGKLDYPGDKEKYKDTAAFAERFNKASFDERFKMFFEQVDGAGASRLKQLWKGSKDGGDIDLSVYKVSIKEDKSIVDVKGYVEHFASDLKQVNKRAFIYDGMQNEQSVSSGNFAWSAGVGVRYEINDSWDADLSYRYIDAGKAKVAGTREKVRVNTNDFMLGVNYNF